MASRLVSCLLCISRQIRLNLSGVLGVAIIRSDRQLSVLLDGIQQRGQLVRRKSVFGQDEAEEWALDWLLDLLMQIDGSLLTWLFVDAVFRGLFDNGLLGLGVDGRFIFLCGYLGDRFAVFIGHCELVLL